MLANLAIASRESRTGSDFHPDSMISTASSVALLGRSDDRPGLTSLLATSIRDGRSR